MSGLPVKTSLTKALAAKIAPLWIGKMPDLAEDEVKAACDLEMTKDVPNFAWIHNVCWSYGLAYDEYLASKNPDKFKAFNDAEYELHEQSLQNFRSERKRLLGKE